MVSTLDLLHYWVFGFDERFHGRRKQHGLEVRRLKELLVPALASPVLLLDLVSGWGVMGE